MDYEKFVKKNLCLSLVTSVIILISLLLSVYIDRFINNIVATCLLFVIFVYLTLTEVCEFQTRNINSRGGTPDLSAYGPDNAAPRVC